MERKGYFSRSARLSHNDTGVLVAEPRSRTAAEEAAWRAENLQHSQENEERKERAYQAFRHQLARVRFDMYRKLEEEVEESGEIPEIDIQLTEELTEGLTRSRKKN